jgi:hypothetical protein
MSTYKRVNGDYTIQTLGANTITFAGNVANAVTVVVDGNFTVTGNATLTGNISGDKLFNGTTSIEIPAANGNANITVGGVSNVAVFNTTGLVIAGNINAGNLSLTGAFGATTLSATGNVTGGNINTAGNVFITRDASVTQPTIRFTDTDTVGVAGQILGAVEWFTSDITAPGVSASIRATLVDTGGNSNVQILTGTPGSLAARLTVLNTGNVGIANTAPLHTFAVSGNTYVSGTETVIGNVTGGNIATGGLVTVTGNVTGANFITAGLVTATGNINGGNLITAGSITAGASGILSTGNVRGGNLVSDAQITAVGNITGTNLITQGIVTAQGNVIANNISAGNIINTGVLNATGNVSATGNVTGSNLVTGGSVTATGAVTGGNITTGGRVSATGNITTSAFFIGDGGFLSNVTAVSNVAVSQIANGTTFMAVAAANGNIFATINAVGNILVLSTTGAAVTGTMSATGNVAGSNVSATANVSAVGNVNAGNIFTSGIANIGTLITTNINANALTSGTVSSDRLSGSYVINVTGNVSGTAATVTNAAQSNITSVGTLTSLAVTGNISGGNLLISGAIIDSAQLDIQTSAANANIVLTPNGTGNVNIGRMSASGNITSTGFNGPLFGAVTSSTTISATGNITGGNLNATGLSLSGNVVSALVSAANITTTANITGGNITAQTNLTAAFISTAGQVSAGGNITGGNINTAGLVSATGNINGANINATGNIITSGRISATGNIVTGGPLTANGTVTGTFLTSTGGYLSLGTYNIDSTAGNAGPVLISGASGNTQFVGNVEGLQLSASGNVTAGNIVTTGTAGILSVNSITHTGTNAVGNIGSASSYFNRVFATATTALYADLAEKYTADQFYLPGTVVSFGGTAEVTASTTANDRRIAGVVSANPSYLMNAGLEAEHTAVVALQGRVPCLVQGPVTKGDMMVSAGNGRAQACDNPLTGAVIGKALENFDGDQGTIEVVVGRI